MDDISKEVPWRIPFACPLGPGGPLLKCDWSAPFLLVHSPKQKNPKIRESIMAKKKIKTIEEKIETLKRRVNSIAMDIYSVNSACALQRIPKLKTSIDIIFWILIMNEKECKSMRDTLISMQEAIHSLEKEKGKN
jgi:hypothetical protein